VAEPDGSRILRASVQGRAADAEVLGRNAARDLLSQGADRILARLLEGAGRD
jgi:hydroxymethylbilane synthase